MNRRIETQQNIFQPAQLTPIASGYLDIFRSLAAMAVLFNHWRAFYFVDYGQVSPPMRSVLVKAIYGFSGFGHQAVMIFFVLSGLFISSSVLRNLERGKWSWMDYAIDRGVRLYVVLVPGLLLGALWDLIGVHFLNHSGIYSHRLVGGFGDGITEQRLNVSSFLGSLFFFQTRFTTVFGSNGPLWSLFNEFWYYVLFPVLVAVILSARRRSISAVAYLGVAILVAWILGGANSGFIVWLAGGTIALTARHLRFAVSSSWQAGLYTLFAAGLTGICLFAARANRGWLGSDMAVGLSFALFIHGIVQLPLPLNNLGLRLAKSFAGFSFSLYVLHFPVLMLIRAKWLPTFRWQPDEIHLLYGAGIVAGVLLYAFVVAHFTERRTSIVRSWVRRQFASRRPLGHDAEFLPATSGVKSCE